jgi:NTE family protein
VNVPVYLGGSLETGNTWDTTDDISFDSTVWASSVFLGLDTVFGPVYFAGGWAEGGERSLYLFVGSP